MTSVHTPTNFGRNAKKICNGKVNAVPARQHYLPKQRVNYTEFSFKLNIALPIVLIQMIHEDKNLNRFKNVNPSH